MKAKIIDLTGRETSEIELPAVFEESYRPDLIKRAVVAAQANRIQPYGSYRMSGLRTSAEGWGTGRGVARVPRIKGGSRAARVPQAVGGRKAHPPKPEKVHAEKINVKERRKARDSAIAATVDESLVRARGHQFEADLPVVVIDEFEDLKKTRDVQAFLEEAGLYEDVLRAKNGKTIRAGKGKMRGRKYKRPNSLLIVIAEDRGIGRAANNLPGVDVVTVNDLGTEDLAPGTHAGRLTVWTRSAIEKLGEGK